MARDRKIRLAGIGAAVLASSMALSPHLLVAQLLAQPENTVQVGDRWTFDQRDEITGLPTATFTHLVTEISPTEYVVRITNQGKTGSSIRIYDHDWNVTERSDFKFKPNNGAGIKPPLAVGKQWQSEYEARNTQTGSAFKESVTHKVTAQEMLETAAGNFDAFKIESRRREINVKDPSKSTEYESTEWYAPKISYWVRRLLITRAQKRVTSNLSEELVAYGRKQ
jgi:hypothetical protein